MVSFSPVSPTLRQTGLSYVISIKKLNWIKEIFDSAICSSLSRRQHAVAGYWLPARAAEQCMLR